MQVFTSRRALQATLRPLLVDVPIGDDVDAEADISFDEEGVVEVEVPLRNAGSGLALIVGGPTLHWQEEHVPTSLGGVSQQTAVAPGERVRLTFRTRFPTAETAQLAVLSADKFEVDLAYTDVNGKQRTRTKAYVIEHPDEDSDIDHVVDRVDLFRGRKVKPFASLSGRAAPQGEAP
jgi:hypothetical protein